MQWGIPLDPLLNIREVSRTLYRILKKEREVIKIEHRTERITFRITPSELDKIEKKAKTANVSISEYTRQSILKDNIIVIEDLKEFTQELRGIGKNLNQLTILSHQGKINTLDLSSTKQKVNEIWQLLNLLMQKMKR